MKFWLINFPHTSTENDNDLHLILLSTPIIGSLITSSNKLALYLPSKIHLNIFPKFDSII